MSSSASSSMTPSALRAFFVFNPLLGDEDTEGEKILFFHPPSTDLNRQKDFVGLSEGLINFTRDFSPQQPCESVHCDQHRYAFLEFEPDHWFVLVVANPCVPASSSAPAAAAAAAAGDARDAGDDELVPLEDELDDAVLHAILRRCAGMFRLFHGSLQALADARSVEVLRSVLGNFMRYFIPTVRFGQLRFFTDINGFQFLPVDKTTFLEVQFLTNTLRTEFTSVRSTAVMYDAHLIWSGIDQDDMFLLYSLEQEYMQSFMSHLAAFTAQRERLLGGADGAPTAVRPGPAAGFLTGRAGAPRVFLGHSERTGGRLVVYRRHHIALFVTLDADSEEHTSGEFYAQLETFWESRLKKLAVQLRKQRERSLNQEDSFRFLYFNHMSLALKTSLNNKSSPLSMETIRLIRRIHADFARAQRAEEEAESVQGGGDAEIEARLKSRGQFHSVSEVCVRTREDGWVVGRRADQTNREYFVLLDGKGNHADMVSVQAEMDRLARTYFYNVFVAN